MKKDEFLRLEINKQIEIINKELASGKSLTIICKEIEVSKGIAQKFNKRGYMYNKNSNQYILSQVPGQENLFKEPGEADKEPISKPKLIKKRNVPLIKRESVKEATEPQKEATKEKGSLRGRPMKKNRVKCNITLDAEVKEALQIYCIKHKITLSDLLEQQAVLVLREE
jgi:hypothetical protein